MVTKIGFFDSGIGGVTVLKECIRLNPSFKYIYYSDSVNNPYGDKSREELISITSNIVSKLIDMGCYIIVIAFLLDDYAINPSNFGMNTPVAAFFKTIGGIAFDFMLVILSGYIAMSIGDRPRTSSWICWWCNCQSRNNLYII